MNGSHMTRLGHSLHTEVSPLGRLPMFIETGVRGQINFGDDFETTVRASVPVLFTYRFALGSERNKISPFAGLNFGFNVVRDVDHHGYSERSYIDDDDINLFQLGMMVGANFTFNRFNIQVGYCIDFMPFYKSGSYSSYRSDKLKINSGTFLVGVGFEF